MRRFHLFAAWLAIAALLIGGLLPTAVAAAAVPEPGSPFALCGAAPGNSPHGQTPPTLPSHPCALCAVCAGGALGVLPGHAGFPAAVSDSIALPTGVRSGPTETRRFARATAQPRAPPQATS